MTRSPVDKYLAEVKRELAAELSFLDAPDTVAEVAIAALRRTSEHYRNAIRNEAIIETAHFIANSVGIARTTAKCEGWRTPEAARAFNQCHKYDLAIIRRMRDGEDPFAPIHKKLATPPTEGTE